MSSSANALSELVGQFESQEADMITGSSSYQETEVRVDFIDKLFKMLGWDMDNDAGLPHRTRDVIREESQPTETSVKRPDYTFRIASIRRFFVEAKKPAVDIRSDRASALQVRSYGYTAGLPISILTNFRTFRVYDTRLEPRQTDDPDTALISTTEYRDLPGQFDHLVRCFGRDQVALGSIEREFHVTLTGAVPVNTSFLERINDWRVRMGQDLHSRYPNLTPVELGDFTQKTISRIIFIRMCEDRGIEGEAILRTAAGRQDVVELRALFSRMDRRYNTGLFDLSQDRLQDTYKIDAGLFLAIVNEIYAPNSPYNFGLLDADFFGEVYEHFLVKRLGVDPGTNSVVLQDKPVYEHREVITTPQPLVIEAVRRAFSAKFDQLQLSIQALKNLRVLDVAVGSGRFLLQAFDELVDKAIESLQRTGGQAHVYRVSDNDYRLDFQTKREILKGCLYGIDIDYGAVEIAKFSLLVRLLEDETASTLPTGQKILPNLDRNIVCGNTVVREDFPITSGAIFDQTLPLSWSSSHLPEAFDIVIGNPPYMKTEDMRRIHPAEVEYYIRTYETPYKQFDKYFVFIELALSRLKSDGWCGMVVPNKWITIDAGSKLRKMLAEHNYTAQILDFGNELVFGGRSTYVCLLVLAKHGVNAYAHRTISQYRDFLAAPHEEGIVLPSARLSGFGENAWILPSNEQELAILDRLVLNSIPLADVASVKNGIQTSANDVLVLPRFVEHGRFIEFDKGDTHWTIEKEITRPFFDDSRQLISYKPVVADARVIFPYQPSSNGGILLIPPSLLAQTYPLTWAYLCAHRPRLEHRDVSPTPPRGVFYAFGRDQALETVFTAPKIIYSVAQRGDKYAVDTAGVACASGGTAGEAIVSNPQQGYALEFLLGLLNQRAIELFLRKRGSPFRGGFFSRGTDVLSDVPVPLLDTQGNSSHRSVQDSIVADVRGLIRLQEGLPMASDRRRRVLEMKQQVLKRALESKFNALWGFTDEVDSLQLPGDTEG